MPIPATSASHDFQGLAQLRHNAQRHDPAALKEAAVQFEALFVGLMLKAAREANLGDGIFDSGQTEQYMELMDQQVALDLARHGGFGFGKLLVEGVGEAWAGEQGFEPDGPAEFVENLMPIASRVARGMGVDPDLLIAQSALETGWGGSVLKFPDGRPAFNLFGIKADNSWSGLRVGQRTLEFVNGVPEQRWEQFRAYQSVEASFQDYAELITGSSRYADIANSEATPDAYAHAIANNGYATDPQYADKWLAIYHGDTLRQAVEDLKGQRLESTH